MPETMLDCYLSQSDCLNSILKKKNDILAGFPEFYRSCNPDRIYLIGSGTSHNACDAARAAMEKWLRVEVTSLAPTAVKTLHGDRPLAIAVSQGGRSTNTVAQVRALKAGGIPVVTMTDPVDTPVGREGSFALSLEAMNELIGPKTRGYTATVLELYLLALETARCLDKVTAKEYDACLHILEDTVSRFPAYYAACQEFYIRYGQQLRHATHYAFAGKATAGCVAREAALKVIETLCFPAAGYEYEEFLHGPGCCADEHFCLFLFLSEDEDRSRMFRTADIIGGASDNCYLISHRENETGDRILCLPCSDPELCAPFTDILFAQLISAQLTMDMGRKRHPAVQDIFSKMGTKVAAG